MLFWLSQTTYHTGELPRFLCHFNLRQLWQASVKIVFSLQVFHLPLIFKLLFQPEMRFIQFRAKQKAVQSTTNDLHDGAWAVETPTFCNFLKFSAITATYNNAIIHVLNKVTLMWRSSQELWTSQDLSKSAEGAPQFINNQVGDAGFMTKHQTFLPSKDAPRPKTKQYIEMLTGHRIKYLLHFFVLFSPDCRLFEASYSMIKQRVKRSFMFSLQTLLLRPVSHQLDNNIFYIWWTVWPHVA